MKSTPLSFGRAVLTIARKELVASFRDKQTTLYTVLLPILLYPLLFFAMIQGSLLLQARRERTPVTVGIAREAGIDLPDTLQRALSSNDPESIFDDRRPKTPEEAAHDELREELHAAARGLQRVDAQVADRPLDERAAREWLAAKPGPDAVFWLRAQDDALGERPAQLFYDSTASPSQIAKSRVEERLPSYAEALRRERARALTADPRTLEPFQLEPARDIAAGEDRGAYLLSFALPMMLVIMTVMGAFYPAVDLTAGERERNTAETTLLLPVPRLAIHQGKILAVSVAAILATTLNLLALGLSAGHLWQMIARTSETTIVLPWSALLSIAPLALLFALFVSAVLTGIAALARTFKEGQALLGPVQMVFMLPAMAGAIPGLVLTPTLACVPVINVVLAFRALLKGESHPEEYALTAISLLLFAVLSMVIAVRVLSRETIGAAPPGPNRGGAKRGGARAKQHGTASGGS